MSFAIRAALPCWPFELSPLSVLNRGTLVRSITLVPFETFDDIWHTCMSGQNGVSRARMVVHILLSF